MKNVAGSDKRERKKCDKDKTRDRGGRERARGERGWNTSISLPCSWLSLAIHLLIQATKDRAGNGPDWQRLQTYNTLDHSSLHHPG